MKVKIFPLFMLLVACVNSGQQEAISIAAAANLYYPLQEIQAAFLAAYPDSKVECTLGASGRLTTQIIHGAPFDLFLSADFVFPEELMSRGLTATAPVAYTTGTLVLFSAEPRDFHAGIKILLDKEIALISIANPETAPYGRMSVAALRAAGIFEAVETKIAYTESISQVVQHVMSASDMGFIAGSALFSGEMKAYNKEGVHWITVDPGLYQPIKQALVILKNGKDKKYVRKFYDFILGKTAQKIFMEYGYSDPR